MTRHFGVKAKRWGSAVLSLFLILTASQTFAETACERACRVRQRLAAFLGDAARFDEQLKLTRGSLPGAMAGFLEESERICNDPENPTLSRFHRALLSGEASRRGLASESAPFVEKKLDADLVALLSAPYVSSPRPALQSQVVLASPFSQTLAAPRGLFDAKPALGTGRSPFAERSQPGVCPEKNSPDSLLQSWNRCLAHRLEVFLDQPTTGGTALLDSLRTVLRKIRVGFRKEARGVALAPQEFEEPLRGGLWIAWLAVEALERRPTAEMFANEVEELRSQVSLLATEALIRPTFTASPARGVLPVAGLVLLSECPTPLSLVDGVLPARFKRPRGKKVEQRGTETHTERISESPSAPPSTAGAPSLGPAAR